MDEFRSLDLAELSRRIRRYCGRRPGDQAELEASIARLLELAGEIRRRLPDRYAEHPLAASAGLEERSTSSTVLEVGSSDQSFPTAFLGRLMEQRR